MSLPHWFVRSICLSVGSPEIWDICVGSYRLFLVRVAPAGCSTLSWSGLGAQRSGVAASSGLLVFSIGRLRVNGDQAGDSVEERRCFGVINREAFSTIVQMTTE